MSSPSSSAHPEVSSRRATSGMVVVRPDEEVMGKQSLPYFVGISGGSAGATGISMNLVVVPPGGAAEPHRHRGFETAVYMVRGEVEVRYGPTLGERLTLSAGEFLFIPADLPHQPVNHDPDLPAFALVARNDADEQESIEHFHPVVATDSPDELLVEDGVEASEASGAQGAHG